MDVTSESDKAGNNGQPVVDIIIDNMTAVRRPLQDVIGLERADVCDAQARPKKIFTFEVVR
ncbi:MAG TPA: hypothetical protein VHY79_18875 [Rhizomicrobium sp.]|jgi:hypothetical protein|nr:hypothetical protein [Rhizomicrobium sp.]